jgi:hypothetical protein
MPTGTCKYPGHHDQPSAFRPVAWLILVAIGAVVISQWRQIIAALIVTGVLAVLGVAVLLLVHNHGRGTDPDLEQQAALEDVQRRQLAAQQRPAISQPAAVHHHQHLHVYGSDGLAAITRTPPGAPEDYQ